MSDPPAPTRRPATRWAAFGAAVVLVGLGAGLGAVALRYTLHWASVLLLRQVVPAYPDDAGGQAIPTGPVSGLGWLLPVLLAAALAAAAALSRLGPGHVKGTDGVIAAVHARELGGLGAGAATAKLAGTAATLGAGGSGGTEGPVAVISAALAGTLTRRLGLTPGERAVLVAAAVGAGVGALFQSPLAGVLLAGEVLRRRGVHWRVVLVAVPVTAVAFGLFAVLYGRRPMFGYADLGALWDPASFGPLLVVGVVCGVLARLYAWTFHRAGAWTARIAWWPECTAAAAGALVGLIGLILPATLGTGYGVVAGELSAVALAAAPLWLLAVLPLVKIAATSITLQSGGVGGVFGPAMVIGATAGALCWRLGTAIGLELGPAALFVMAGLAACLGSAVRTPIAALVLAGEAVGAVVPPLGVAVAVAAAVCCAGAVSLFPSQAESELPRGYRQLSEIRRRLPALSVSVMLRSGSETTGPK